MSASAAARRAAPNSASTGGGTASPSSTASAGRRLDVHLRPRGGHANGSGSRHPVMPTVVGLAEPNGRAVLKSGRLDLAMAVLRTDPGRFAAGQSCCSPARGASCRPPAARRMSISPSRKRCGSPTSLPYAATLSQFPAGYQLDRRAASSACVEPCSGRRRAHQRRRRSSLPPSSKVASTTSRSTPAARERVIAR